MNDNQLDERDQNILADALQKAQYTVFKSYIHELKNMSVLCPDEDIMDITSEQCIRLLHLKKLTRQKGEDEIQKLTTVYNSVLSTGASLIVMIDAPRKKDDHIDIYLGVKHYTYDNVGNQTATALKTLKSGMESQFPGTEMSPITTNKTIDKNVDNILDDIFDEKVKSISTVSTVASIRDKGKTENKTFIQGIEHLIDAMRGKSYTALFIADPISSVERANIRSGLESLYTAIAPFAKSTWSYNENNSEAVMKSLSSTVGETVTNGTAWTQSHTVSHSHGTTDSLTVQLNESINTVNYDSQTRTEGHNSSININPGNILGAIVNVAATAATIVNPAAGAIVGFVGGNIARAASGINIGKGKSSSIAETIGKSIGKSLGASIGYGHSVSDVDSIANQEANTKNQSDTQLKQETEQTANTITTGMGRTLQIENQNKMVIEILKQLDEQIKRLKESEDYGLFSCGAYFISRDNVTCTLAANTYRALMIGEGTSVESSAVNTWSGSDDEDRINAIQQYLKRFCQPIFVEAWDNDGNYMPFSAATMVSGLELPLHLGLPMSSVSGLTVTEHAAFGRNVDDNEDGILLGNLYHMGRGDGQKVWIDKKYLTGHVFVTGSTGSGKSNTIYQMLSELKKQGIKFLVIEPAKGEYKNVFGTGDEPVTVYGTNPKYTDLLRINPFTFPDKIHIYEHIDRLVEIFNACWPMYAAMPAVLKDAIERAYVDSGWDMKKSENKHKLYPTFADVLDKINDVMEESKYSSDSKGDYIGALSTRLKSMTIGINSMIFTTNELSNEELFENNVIADLSRVGSIETKSLIMGLLIMKQQEYRISQESKPNEDLNHVTVLEEAHNLLKRTSTEQSTETSNLIGKSVEMLANSIAEMRTYGEGFIIADQSPGLLDMSVIRNTNTKIIMRLPDLLDRELVGRAAGLNDEQITELAKIKCGVAAVYQNDWVEAVLCEVKEYAYDKNSTWTPKNSTCSKYNYDLTEEIVNIIMEHKLKEHDIDDFKTKIILADNISSGVKRVILEYFEVAPEDVNLKLSELSYKFFNSARIMELFNFYSDIEKWEQAAIDVITPDIRGYGKDEVQNVLLLILREGLENNIIYENIYQAYREHLHSIRRGHNV